MRRRELAARLRELDATDDFATGERQQLELRIIAIEEVIAARWPRRILVRARLARALRASVRDTQGEDFEERRLETASIMVTLPGWARQW